MDFTKEKIRIVQETRIVVGEQTRLYDTLLIRYVLWNMDSVPHGVGLRIMLDTCIGSNAGPSIYVPPTKKFPQAQLVNTKADLVGPQLPEFVRVLEDKELNDRDATVADLGLVLKGLEPVNRLVVCHWPQDNGGGETGWDWPFKAIDEPKDKPKETCVVLYWAEQKMRPGEKRILGFTYGLGRTTNGTLGLADLEFLTRPAK